MFPHSPQLGDFRLKNEKQGKKKETDEEEREEKKSC